MPTIINGNPYGFSTVDGLGAGFTDIINLFGFFNTFNSFGASDTVNVWTGGFDTLNMVGTGVTDQINLDGSVYDTINGVGMSNSTFNVTGGGGGNTGGSTGVRREFFSARGRAQRAGRVFVRN